MISTSMKNIQIEKRLSLDPLWEKISLIPEEKNLAMQFVTYVYYRKTVCVCVGTVDLAADCPQPSGIKIYEPQRWRQSSGHSRFIPTFNSGGGGGGWYPGLPGNDGNMYIHGHYMVTMYI
jgi:hypothetical protein